jgi:hypothetical protein
MLLRYWAVSFAVAAAGSAGCGSDATNTGDAAAGDGASGSGSSSGSTAGSGTGSGASSGSGSGTSGGSLSGSSAGSGSGSGSSSGSTADAGPHDASIGDARADGPQNDPSCPATYGSDGGACPANASCRYPEGFCDCESPHCGGAPLPDASTTPVWRCSALAPSCPYAIVDSGACTPPGTKCSYGYCCSPTIECTDSGSWANGAPFCPP